MMTGVRLKNISRVYWTLLLQPQEMTNGVDKVICFAPGEGNRPLGIFMDTESEYLSFPTVFFVGNKELLSKREKCLSPIALYVNGI